MWFSLVFIRCRRTSLIDCCVDNKLTKRDFGVDDGTSTQSDLARLSPVPAFVENLRILIEDLTTPADNRVSPFLRIVDADPQWRRYLFGRQRPDTRVEEMSWYWRFLLMMTLLRQLTWTRKFKESELSTI